MFKTKFTHLIWQGEYRNHDNTHAKGHTKYPKSSILEKRILAHIYFSHVCLLFECFMQFYIRFSRTREVRRWADITTPEDLKVGIGTRIEDTFL
jgi:hypothetical protein